MSIWVILNGHSERTKLIVSKYLVYLDVLKKWSYVFILLSVFITCSHNVVAHHHHFADVEHHHGDDADHDSDHNVFSFAQLDEVYIHSNDQVHVNNSFVTLFYIQPLFVFDLKIVSSSDEFSIVEVFPPPKAPFSYTSILRGPPIS
jgi:hypothetical protein